MTDAPRHRSATIFDVVRTHLTAPQTISTPGMDARQFAAVTALIERWPGLAHELTRGRAGAPLPRLGVSLARMLSERYPTASRTGAVPAASPVSLQPDPRELMSFDRIWQASRSGREAVGLAA